jgi:hypothetical protein
VVIGGGLMESGGHQVLFERVSEYTRFPPEARLVLDMFRPAE